MRGGRGSRPADAAAASIAMDCQAANVGRLAAARARAREGAPAEWPHSHLLLQWVADDFSIDAILVALHYPIVCDPYVAQPLLS